MYIRVETKWGCWNKGFLRTGNCQGTMVVIGSDESYSVMCGTCNFGQNGKGAIPEGYINRLYEEGYIRQMGRRPAERDELQRFFTGCVRGKRSPSEIAGDLLENYEVFLK